jgi:hypothetical protein
MAPGRGKSIEATGLVPEQSVEALIVVHPAADNIAAAVDFGSGSPTVGRAPGRSMFEKTFPCKMNP